MDIPNEADPVATEQAAAPAPQIAQAPVSNQAARLEDIWPEAVSHWLASSIHNSPVSRTVEGYNHLVSVLPALLQALQEMM